MLTKKYIQKELALRIKGIRPNVTTNTDVLIGELKSALMMVDCLPDDEPEKKYNEAMLRADEAVQKGCLDKDMFDIIFPPEESEDERIRNCLRCLTSLDQAQDVIADMGFTRQDLLSYLEKQKEQKPVEWSEEETKDLVHILKVLDDCYAYGKHDLSKTDHDNLTSTIKSLRPQWKPSEEKMEALQRAIDACESEWAYQDDELRSLLDDLKKL